MLKSRQAIAQLVHPSPTSLVLSLASSLCVASHPIYEKPKGFGVNFFGSRPQLCLLQQLSSSYYVLQCTLTDPPLLLAYQSQLYLLVMSSLCTSFIILSLYTYMVACVRILDPWGKLKCELTKVFKKLAYLVLFGYLIKCCLVLQFSSLPVLGL